VGPSVGRMRRDEEKAVGLTTESKTITNYKRVLEISGGLMEILKGQVAHRQKTDLRLWLPRRKAKPAQVISHQYDLVKCGRGG